MQVYTYDPSYDESERPAAGEPRRRVGSLPMLGTKALEILKGLQKRQLKVEKILVGGGGNTDGTCRAQSLRWIKDFVAAAINGTPAPDTTGWEEVRR